MINVSINRKSVLGVPEPNANSMSSANYKDVAFLLHGGGVGWDGGDDKKHAAKNYICSFLKCFIQASLLPLQVNFPQKNKVFY
jgi:hypothetical protein